MKNIIILILCVLFLVSCQEIKKDNHEKSISLPKNEIISPKYEIYNAVIKKMRWNKDTILVYTYFFDNETRKNYDYSYYDTTKLLNNKVVLGKDTYKDFTKKIQLVEEVDKKLIKGTNIFINTDILKNKRHKKIILKFSPIGFNRDTTKAFLIYEKTEDGGGSKNCLLFEKTDNEWDSVYHKHLAYIIGCW